MTAPDRLRALVEWDGYSWVATLPNVPGSVTQAEHIDLLPGRIAEAASLLTGDRISAEHISLHARVDGNCRADREGNDRD